MHKIVGDLGYILKGSKDLECFPTLKTYLNIDDKSNLLNFGLFMYSRGLRLQTGAVDSSITGIVMHCICDLRRSYQCTDYERRDAINLYKRLESLLRKLFNR